MLRDVINFWFREAYAFVPETIRVERGYPLQRDSQGRGGSCFKFTKKVMKTLEIISRGFLRA